MERYVEGYDICQQMKLSKVLKKLWTHLIVDFITKLPLVAGKDAIPVVCDRLSKMTYFVATIEGILVEELARLFKDNVWKLYKLPESIISDRGLQFAAEMIKELNNMLEIEMKLLISFHLQTDGQTEKINQKIK